MIWKSLSKHATNVYYEPGSDGPFDNAKLNGRIPAWKIILQKQINAKWHERELREI